MKDYISRDLAKAYFTPEHAFITPVFVTVETLLQAIDNIPAADVAPVKHGRWIRGENGVIKCDQCGGHPPYYMMATTCKASKFCPDCGARMDGDANVD